MCILLFRNMFLGQNERKIKSHHFSHIQTTTQYFGNQISILVYSLNLVLVRSKTGLCDVWFYYYYSGYTAVWYLGILSAQYRIMGTNWAKYEQICQFFNEFTHNLHPLPRVTTILSLQELCYPLFPAVLMHVYLFKSNHFWFITL